MKTKLQRDVERKKNYTEEEEEKEEKSFRAFQVNDKRIHSM